MSCFMLSENHLCAIVTAFLHLGGYAKTSQRVYDADTMRTWGDSPNKWSNNQGTPSDMLYLLRTANAIACHTRYHGQELAVPYVEFASYAPFLPSAGVFTVRQLAGIAKAAQCFAYQCSDAPNWEGSFGQTVYQQIMSGIVAKLPGYDAAEWAIE